VALAFEKAKEIGKARLVKMPSGVVTSAFHSMFIGEREEEILDW